MKRELCLKLFTANSDFGQSSQQKILKFRIYTYDFFCFMNYDLRQKCIQTNFIAIFEWQSSYLRKLTRL